MQNAVVNVNGQIMSPQQAKVSVFDRSYLYGDSLYEVVRTRNGVIVHMNEHLHRLEESAKLCRMVLGQTPEKFAAEIHRTFAAFRALPGMATQDAYCRLVVSRGEGKIGFGLKQLTTSTLFSIIVQPLELPTPQQLQTGVKLKIVDRLRNHPQALDPAMKSGNYLNSLLAYLEGTPEGFDDALMLNQDGHVTEGTVFNVGYFKRGIFVTPPLDIGILDGITRRELLIVCKNMGIETREIRFPRERLYEADEVCWISTTKEVFPVVQVDQYKIASGKPGKLTLQVRAAYQKHVDELAAGEQNLLQTSSPTGSKRAS